MLDHDRLQRTLQLRAAADRAFAALPAGPEALAARSTPAASTPPSQPSATTCPSSSACSATSLLRGRPRDSHAGRAGDVPGPHHRLPVKLGREALAQHLPPELIADLYPVGSWRDHPPAAARPRPHRSAARSSRTSRWTSRRRRLRSQRLGSADLADVLARQTLALLPACLRRLRRRLERLGRLRRAHRLRQADALERYAPRARRAEHLVRGRSAAPPTPLHCRRSTPPASRCRACHSSSPATTTTSPGDSPTSAPTCRTSTSSTRAAPVRRRVQGPTASGAGAVSARGHPRTRQR